MESRNVELDTEIFIALCCAFSSDRGTVEWIDVMF